MRSSRKLLVEWGNLVIEDCIALQPAVVRLGNQGTSGDEMGRLIIAILGSILLVGGLWLLWGLYSVEIAHWALGSIFIPAQAGPWGDSFGPFSAFFSALGFAAVLVTLIIQQRQIKEAQRDQHRQRFDGTFFELLRFLREARVAVRFQHTERYVTAGQVVVANRGKTYEAEEAFRAAMKETRFWYNGNLQAYKDKEIELYREIFHSRYESKLGPYFRMLYTILNRISEDPILTTNEKEMYGNLVRSQLTSHEAALAGLNGLASFAKDLPRLIHEFRLLKYLTSDTAKRMLEPHYPKDAFESRGNPQS